MTISNREIGIIGGSEIGLLYGTYQTIEQSFGVRFYLHGDVISHNRKFREISIKNFPKKFQPSPSFDITGILPVSFLKFS